MGNVVLRLRDDMLLVRHDGTRRSAALGRRLHDPPRCGMTTLITHTSLRARARGLAVRTALTATVLTVAMFTIGTAASAEEPELPVNELAPQITTEADLAVAAYSDYSRSDDLADYLRYAKHRTATARLAAQQLGYDEFTMINAWQNATIEHQRAVLAAMTQIGVPYKTNASAEDEGFDCSGLTSFAWQASGVELNRISGDQIAAAAKVDRASAQPGDLAHFPGHVMMYLGVDDAVVHSVNTGRTVEIDTISQRSVDRVVFGDPSD